MSLQRLPAVLTTVLVTVLVGFLIAVQFRTQIQIQTSPQPPERIEALTEVLTETEKARTLLQQEVSELRQRIAASNIVDSSGKVSALAEENRQLQQFAGLTSVTGPGVVISVSAITTPKHPNNAVMSRDLLLLVNELRAGGAEAIAVNDQRLVASSEIREAGSYILVNLTRVSPPYVIKAIGDADMLEKTLLMRNGIVDYLAGFNVIANPVKQAQVPIPAWDGAIRQRFAVPEKKTPQ